MPDEPLVSILINNYNYGRFLAEAIGSALSQAYRNIEVIVVDDGSTDDSRDVIARYHDRVKGIFKGNGGQASAFNAGFAASRGEIVIFLDADDWLGPTAVDEVVRAWRPGLSKVQFRLQILDLQGREQGIKPSPWIEFDSGSVAKLLMEQGVYVAAPTSGNAFSRDALAQILPVPEQEFALCADQYVNFSVVFFGDVESLDKVLGYYRVHGNNGWSFNGVLDAATLHKWLKNSVTQHNIIRMWAGRCGIKCPGDLSARDHEHVLRRLTSFKLERSDHPFPEDTRWSLMTTGLRALWRSSRYTLKTKIALSVWWLVIPCLPRAYAAKAFKWKWNANERPQLLKRLMSALQSIRLHQTSRRLV